jgi:putative DNA primase/helicase
MAARAGSPQILTNDLYRATNEAWETLLDANSTTDAGEFFFRYGSEPSRFEHDEEGRLIPRVLTPDRMKHRLSTIAWWGFRYGDTIRELPGAPTEVVRNVLATPDPPLPMVTRIVEVPVLGHDGSIHDTPGYSAAHRVFYEPAEGLVLPQLPKRGVTKKELARPAFRREIARARELILDELLGDFPFTGEAERAHAFCLTLQPFVRDLIAGPTPLYLPEAPAPGTGKGLLAHAACWPMLGGQVPTLSEGRDEDEWRKRITAKLRQSPVAVLIDNLRAPLDSAALSSVLTSEVWEDRKLGHSETLMLPNRATWIATGNNPQLSGEILRRTIRIRLDAKMEHPEDRERFRHSNLLAWANEHRGELVWAALLLGRAWVAAGRPKGARSLGSFESWAHVMGGICEVAGVPGFLGNLDEHREHAGSEHEDMLAFLTGWRAYYKDGRHVKTREIVPHLLELLGVEPSSRGAAHRAGKLLAAQVDRRYGDYVLQRGPTTGGTATWRVVKA